MKPGDISSINLYKIFHFPILSCYTLYPLYSAGIRVPSVLVAGAAAGFPRCSWLIQQPGLQVHQPGSLGALCRCTSQVPSMLVAVAEAGLPRCSLQVHQPGDGSFVDIQKILHIFYLLSK